MKNIFNKRKAGSEAEDLAVKHLESLGYEILERNWHFSNRGEIDIVALDPNRWGDRYLVFVEVRSRKSSMEDSIHSFDNKKQTQVKLLAPAYIRRKNIDPNYLGITFDFIAVHNGEVEHIKDVF